jgi:hypothetical protein
MLLIRPGKKSIQGTRVRSRPVPQKVLSNLRARINADGPLIDEMARKRRNDTAALAHVPVGGEDEYFKTQRKNRP